MPGRLPCREHEAGIEATEEVAQAPGAICEELREGTCLPSFSTLHWPPTPDQPASPLPSTRRSSVYVQGALLSPGFQSTSAVSW